MAYRSIVSAGYASRTEIKPSAPSGLTAGDTVVGFIGYEDLAGAITAPSGGSWTLQEGPIEIDATADEDLLAYLYVLPNISASDVANWTDDAVSLFDMSTTAGAYYAFIAVSGRAASPIDDSAFAENESWSALPSVSVTASGADTDLLGCVLDYLAGGVTPPSGWTERAGHGSIEVHTIDGQGSGSHTYDPADGAGRGRCVLAIALAPAAGGGDPQVEAWQYRGVHNRRRRPWPVPSGPMNLAIA